MNNFSDLPIEIQIEILSYIIRCKADNKLYINKELHCSFDDKLKKCKFINMLGKKICSECWEKEINQISKMFNYLY